jgi:enamine deaminase RidA (YjgF/YER057c/UK114 family)
LDIINPNGWPRPRGYNNGIAADGRVVFVAGQIGWNAQQVFESSRLTDQIDQALANVLEVLAAAGAGPEHVARMNWYLTDVEEYQAGAAEVGTIWRRHMGRHFPAMSVVEVARLVEADAKVEIEATAVVPR